MVFDVIQQETDKIDYVNLFESFIQNKGIKTEEKLELRFECLATEFCMLHSGIFNAQTKTMDFARAKSVSVNFWGD